MSGFTTSPELSTLSHADEMKKLGISTSYELERFNKVQFLAGDSVAMREIQRNLESYEREFLQDEPVGLPHDYYHISGELYSESLEHPLFNIKKQIDPREREGATLRGFTSFEKIITESSDNEVAVWYSPAGKAGSEGPFNDIYFDSGRLYIAFNNGDRQSVHLDIKVNEETFPIKEFMDYVNYSTNGSRSPSHLNTNQAGQYYLEKPIQTHRQTQYFLELFHDFVTAYDSEKVVYVSQRESKNPKPHTLGGMYKEVSGFMQDHISAKAAKLESQTINRDQNIVLDRQQISAMYIDRIAPYVARNNGQMTLYGCSTTSTVSNSDFTGSSSDILSLLSPSTLFSPYGTNSRSPVLIPEKEQEYKYTEEGECNGCHRPHTEVGKLGPCMVCKHCTERDNEIQRKRKLLQHLGFQGEIYTN